MFFPEGCFFVYTHSYCNYSSSGSLVGPITLGMTSDVFELSHKANYFATGCGHIKYVDFGMLVIWMSGI